MTRIKRLSADARNSGRYEMPDYDRPPSPVVTPEDRAARRASAPSSSHFFGVRASDFVALPLTGRGASNPVVLGPLENAARPLSCGLDDQQSYHHRQQISSLHTIRPHSSNNIVGGNQIEIGLKAKNSSPSIQPVNYFLIHDTNHADVLSDIVQTAECPGKRRQRPVSARPPKPSLASDDFKLRNVTSSAKENRPTSQRALDTASKRSGRPVSLPMIANVGKPTVMRERNIFSRVHEQNMEHEDLRPERQPRHSVPSSIVINDSTQSLQADEVPDACRTDSSMTQTVWSKRNGEDECYRPHHAPDLYDLDNWSDAVDTVGTESITAGMWPDAKTSQLSDNASDQKYPSSADNKKESCNNFKRTSSVSRDHSSQRKHVDTMLVTTQADTAQAQKDASQVVSMHEPLGEDAIPVVLSETSKNILSQFEGKDTANIVTSDLVARESSLGNQISCNKYTVEPQRAINSVTSNSSSPLLENIGNNVSFSSDSLTSSAYATADEGDIFLAHSLAKSPSQTISPNLFQEHRVVRVSGQLGGFDLADESEHSYTATDSSVDFKYQDASEDDADSESPNNHTADRDDENIVSHRAENIWSLKLPQASGERHSVGDHLSGLTIKSPALSSLSRDEGSNLSLSSHSSKHRITRSGKRVSDESDESRSSVPADFYSNDPYDVFCASRDSPLRPRRNSYINRLLTGQVRERPPSVSSTTTA